jgi:hypothetical protein
MHLNRIVLLSLCVGRCSRAASDLVVDTTSAER